MKIAQSDLFEMIMKLDSDRIFAVTFVKRTDGAVRNMVCRQGVTKGVKGTGRRFDPAAKNLVSVYDMQAGGFRFINAETITRLKVDGEEYTT
jgi:hypothetical protein